MVELFLLQTLAAIDLHFGYSTPKKKTFAIHCPFDMDGNWYDEIEAPNALLRKSKYGRKVTDISVDLLTSIDEEDH